MAAIFLGAALIALLTPSAHGGLLGDLAVAGACLCWAIDNNCTSKIADVDALTLASIKRGRWRGEASLALVMGGLLSPGLVAASAMLGFFGYGLSLVLFVLALREIGAARTGAYFSTAPFIGAVVGLVALREPLRRGTDRSGPADGPRRLSSPHRGAAGMNRAPPAQSLSAIFWRFLRFGLLAWGGPVAQIAMIKRELVEEEHWIEPSRFNRLLAIYQVLPGPEAHELCVHFGMMKGRRLGGLLAGLAFMLPGLLLILAIAWFYRRLDLQQPQIAAVFVGIQIGVIALIARAVHRIADHTLAGGWLWAIAIASAAGAALGVSFWVTLPAAGFGYAALAGRRYALAAIVVVAAVIVALLVGGNPLCLDPASRPAPSTMFDQERSA